MNGHQKKWMFWTVGVCSLLLFGSWLFFFRYRAFTDDAYVQGNLVAITPLQNGFVTAILTDDTYLVKQGQLLVELDNTDAKIALESAKEQLALKTREITGSFHELFALQAEVESKKAEFLKAAQDYEHRLGVLEIGAVSVEDFEHAESALKSTFFNLMQAERMQNKMLSFLQGTSISTHPDVLIAVEQARQAFVNLYRTKIYSPVEGLVAQRNTQVGSYVVAGDSLMAVIPLDQIWINANFKETQMKKMRIGQKVFLTSDLYGKEVAFHGRIVGLPGGAGNVFSLLPPQNLSGNWIKIVQRLPVRVEIDSQSLVRYPLRLGLSMEATVDLRTKGPLVPVSPAGAPTYTTPIFNQEEAGDASWIQDIIRANTDPSLEAFFSTPLSNHFPCS